MKFRVYLFVFVLSLLFVSLPGFCQVGMNDMQTISIKKGSAASLRANSSGASSFMWFKNGVLIPNYNRQTLITTEEGIYRVASLNLEGCTSDLSDEIRVLLIGELMADIEITKRSESRMVMSNQVFEYYLNVRNNGADDASNVLVKDVLPENLVYEGMSDFVYGVAKYDVTNKTIIWNIPKLINQQFTELVIKVSAKQAGLITNTATVMADEFDSNLNNNTSTDNKTIAGIRIPNVFTPNGDGKNETFFIENLDRFESNEVTIINRWGSTVYQTKGYLNDWTATGLADGTYYYVVKVKNGLGKWAEYKGYITVIR